MPAKKASNQASESKSRKSPMPVKSRRSATKRITSEIQQRIEAANEAASAQQTATLDQAVRIETPATISLELPSQEIASAIEAEATPAIEAVTNESANETQAIVEIPSVIEYTSTIEVVRDRSAILSLIDQMRYMDADTARDAASSLGSMPADAEAVAALMEVVSDFAGYYHPVVRTAAATALGQLRCVEAIDALIIATRDEMAEASEEAVRALGLIGDSRAIEALEAVVANWDGFYLWNVRRTAEEALTRINAGR